MLENAPLPAAENDRNASNRVKSIPFYKLCVNQTDWSAQHIEETWYGHHKPVSRAFAFVCFSTIVSTTCLLCICTPVLWKISLDKTLIEHHVDCAKSLCGAAQAVKLDCLIDGPTRSDVRVDYAQEMPDMIPFPPICWSALTKTFDENFLLELNSVKLLKIKEISSVGKEQDDDGDPILEILPNCTVRTTPNAFIPTLIQSAAGGESWDLINFTNYMPGDRAESVLNSFVCSEEMSDDFVQNRLPLLQEVHEFLLGPVLPFLGAFVIVSVLLMLKTLQIVTATARVFLLTVMVRRFLPWPKDFRSEQQITFWSTYRMLLLLTVLTEYRGEHLGDFVLMGFLVYGAYANGSIQAALEWGQLGLLWYGGASLIPYLDALSVFDGLGIIRFLAYFLGTFVPGDGWWKLVPLHVYWRCYSTLRNHEKVKHS